MATTTMMVVAMMVMTIIMAVLLIGVLDCGPETIAAVIVDLLVPAPAVSVSVWKWEGGEESLRAHNEGLLFVFFFLSGSDAVGDREQPTAKCLGK